MSERLFCVVAATENHSVGNEHRGSGSYQRRGQAATREQILVEAAKLFRTQGRSNTTTRDIAASVGISQPSLYGHFPSRASIETELGCQALETLCQLLGAQVHRKLPINSHCDKLCRVYLDFGLSDTAVYVIAFGANPHSLENEHYERLKHGRQGVLETLTRVVLTLKPNEQEAELSAQLLLASLNGLVLLLVDSPSLSENTREQLTCQLVNAAVCLLRQETTNVSG